MSTLLRRARKNRWLAIAVTIFAHIVMIVLCYINFTFGANRSASWIVGALLVTNAGWSLHNAMAANRMYKRIKERFTDV